jgi:hypothetical protein
VNGSFRVADYLRTIGNIKIAPQARDEAASQNLTLSLHHSPIHHFGAKSQFRGNRFRVSSFGLRAGHGQLRTIDPNAFDRTTG